MSDRKKVRNEEMEFEVMPDADGIGSGPEAAVPGKIFSGGPPAKTPKFRFGIIFGALLGVFILGVAAYFAYGKFFKKTDREIAAPDIQVGKPVGDLDADRDGLIESEENRLATSPTKADTDGDGLADGDEANVYQSDPLLYDTDGDTFDDGREVARQFSPLATSAEKASAEELRKWTDGIVKFGLHEPTQTTLRLKAETGSEQKTTYVSQTHGYSVDVPDIFRTRESEGGRNVGIYASTQVSDDPDVTTDPISIVAAVKVSGQTLRQWVNSQYPASDYQQLRDIRVNSLSGIELLGMPQEDDCSSNRTFFSKDNSVIFLTWRCTSATAFAEYYDQIVQSFKFQ